ncbi:MAG TPA: riboflavin synthase [Bacillus sp. (in: firmicutes)]|uniref:riboflavin synthase n=1 Tax=Bacillus litorisediminis TaxID=2922713 RepID=UPI001FAF0F37|nr:riboflavin synthase [Bacillus litorisediminis]HWO76674.1 riboflavin synthase [Bacillus sp. (in: firmicutes)]
MFTGIVEEIGTIREIKQGKEAMTLTIQAKITMEDIHLGDSYSINGVCLTVTSFTKDQFTVDVMPETFHNTALSKLKVGSPINIERAMAANGRFGGHFVSGHVDGVGTIVGRTERSNAIYLNIQVPEHIEQFLIHRGSVTLDGTSLTIFSIEGNVITVSLIPHTAHVTILGGKKIGDLINVEADMLAKYIASLLNNRSQQKEKKGITLSFLNQHGFLS